MAAALEPGFRPLLRNRPLAGLHGRCSNCATLRLTPSGPSLRTPRRTPVSARGFSSNTGKRPRFSQRLGEALRNSKIQWYQIPVGVGIGFLGLVQFYKISAREQERQTELQDGLGEPGQRKKRPKVKPEGPW